MVLQSYTDELGKISSIYDSSNVLASKYDPNLKKFVIIFGNGGQYLYENVDRSTFNSFQSAKSQGSLVHSLIKSHKQTKLDPVDVVQIKEDIIRNKNERK
jgi:hypothetical protein